MITIIVALSVFSLLLIVDRLYRIYKQNKLRLEFYEYMMMSVSIEDLQESLYYFEEIEDYETCLKIQDTINYLKKEEIE